MDDASYLRSLGERLRIERARRGMSRRLVAECAGVSERYITQIESGKGNVSILLLRQVAAALGVPLERLVEEGPSLEERGQRVALIGLRGAGKTTLGNALAEALQVPFLELDREIERLAGMALGSLIELYGQPAYRRYEQQALEEVLATNPRFVLATGGGLVSEPATYELLLRRCFTVWVRATPEDHMARVVAQGDLRPMAGSARAMDDLRRILAERTPLYARADVAVDTSGRSVQSAMRDVLRALPNGTEL